MQECVKTVTAAVIVRSGKVLLCRRAPGEKLAGFWEFPGGKLEPGETLQQCLERELYEELGVSALAGRIIGRSVYRYEHGKIELTGIETQLAPVMQRGAAEFSLSVHDAAEWVPAAELLSYKLAPADVPIAETVLRELSNRPGGEMSEVDRVEFTFEKWTEKYIPDLIKHADNPRVARNLRNIFPNPYTESDARAWIDICRNADESMNYNRAIVINGEAVGGIGLVRGSDVYCKTAEIGYWLGEDFWGRGIMTRAAVEMCRIGFEELGLVRIFAGAFARNAGSRRVLEKAGFTLEGIQRMNIFKNGEYDDSCMYAVFRQE